MLAWLPLFHCFLNPIEGQIKWYTYSVTSSILLLGTDNETLALGGVQGALTLDDGLAGGRATSVSGSNARNGVPVAHFEDRCKVGDKMEVLEVMVD